MTIFILIIYFIAIYILAFIAMRRTQNHQDYILAGRKLSGPVTALGVGASDMSGWLMLGLPGAVYLLGLSQIWLPLGLVIGAYINWRVTAPRLRIYSEMANDSLTIPSYLANRFGDKKHLIRLFTAITIIIFFTLYGAAGFVGAATLFSHLFEITYFQALLISAVIIVCYTAIGGFLAINWIDLFQGSLMLLALLLIPAIAIFAVDLNLTLPELRNIIEFNNVTHNLSLIGIISLMAWGLGYFGQPHILIRFMAVKSLKDLTLARRVCMTWMILALIGSILVGYMGIAMFGPNQLNDAEGVFIEMTSRVTHPIITGLVLSAILSAIMSTISSQLHASASAIVEDLYRSKLNPNASQKSLVWLGRTMIFAVAIVAFLMSLDSENTVLGLVSRAWAGLGAAFGPVLVASLYWRRMNQTAAIAGILSGGITVMIWPVFANIPEASSFYAIASQLSAVYEIIPGIIISIIAIYLFTIFGKAPEQSFKDKFDLVEKTLYDDTNK